MERNRNRGRWPGWMEPLRPDEVARARMRAIILRDARWILDGRLGWEGVAAGWARMLMPIAAVLVLFFAGLAHQAAPGAMSPAAITLEELIEEEDPGGTLGVLAANVEPSPDWALTAVIDAGNDNR